VGSNIIVDVQVEPTSLPQSTCIHLSLNLLRVDILNGWPLPLTQGIILLMVQHCIYTHLWSSCCTLLGRVWLAKRMSAFESQLLAANVMWF